MEYKITYLGQKENEILEKIISEDEFSKIMNSVSWLKTTMPIKDYLYMVNKCIDELLIASKTTGCGQEHNFSELNRLFNGFIGNYYSWLSYMEKHYKTVLLPIKKKAYDNNIEYRLIYYLREFASHYDMAVDQVTFDVLTENVHWYIKPESLLHYDLKDINKRFEQDIQFLKSNNQKIDVFELVLKFRTIFDTMIQEIYDALIPEINQHWNFLVQHLKIEEKCPFLIIDVYICEIGNDKHPFNLTGFVNLFNKKMQTDERA